MKKLMMVLSVLALVVLPGCMCKKDCKTKKAKTHKTTRSKKCATKKKKPSTYAKVELDKTEELFA